MAEMLVRTPATASATREVAGLIELEPAAMINLRGSGDDPAFSAAVANVIGAAPPMAANRFVEAGLCCIAWLGPDEWLIIAPAGEETRVADALAEALAGQHHAVTDVSGNRAAFRLSGARARDLLAAGSPYDFHPRAFGPGHCTQSVLARTGAIILQRDDAPTFDILVRRSFARYLWEWLATAARLAG